MGRNRDLLTASLLCAGFAFLTWSWHTRTTERKSDDSQAANPAEKWNSKSENVLGVKRELDARSASSSAAELMHRLIATGRIDLNAALSTIETEVPKIDRTRVRLQLMQYLCESEPRFILQAPMAISDEQLPSLIKDFVNWWTTHDSMAPLEHLDAIPSERLQLRVKQNMVIALGRTEQYKNAKVYLAHMGSSAERTDAIAQLVSMESVKHADETVDWVNTLTSTDENRTATEILLHNLIALKDAINIPRLAEGATPEMQPMIWSAAGKIAGEGRDTHIIERHKGLSESNRDALALGLIATAPEQELQSLLQLLKNSSQQSTAQSASVIYVQRIVRIDPLGAAAWALESPESIRKPVLVALINQWQDRDQKGVISWIQNLSSGADKDVALETISRIVARSDRNAAIRLAERIGNAKRRELTIKYLP